MNALELSRLLRSHRFRFDSEGQLQDRVQTVFDRTGVVYEREVVLSPKDRIDFVVGKIGLEVKVDSPTNAVLRQLHRYVQFPELDSIVLLTNRSKHLALPGELNGKPVEIVFTEASL